MSTEDEQHNAYKKMALENAYDILCYRFCLIDKMFEFEKMTLKEKQAVLLDIAEKII